MTTAEEFLKEKVYITQDDIEDVHDSLMSVKDAMIEFTKLHVEAALKKASKEVNLHYKERTNFILNAYPLENIK